MGDSLFHYLRNRVHDDRIITHTQGKNNSLNISVEVNNKFQYDYCIDYSNKKWVLKAKDKKTALWLIRQCVRRLADSDSRIDANDLPPSIINWENPCANFDFVYRDPHLSPNLKEKDPKVPFSGANSVEEYWDIWGHNLNKILSKEALSKDIYARRNSDIDTLQFCFSSDDFFNSISSYLTDSIKKLHSGRFVIMPKDSRTACTCDRCKELGNTDYYATPAVLELIDRLASAYPKYSFYTVAYHSTMKPPSRQKFRSKKNNISGILISTSDLPKGISHHLQNDSDKEFKETVEKWKFYTDTIYVWDYAANFNDFLTPLPSLYVLKKNLEFYRGCGIKGVFLQGSGYDYSPFDDMKTFVSTALMINGRLHVDSLCRSYFSQFYPSSGKILADYYLSLEQSMEQKKKTYDLHGDLNNAIKSYFIVEDFMAFYQKLDSLISISETGEKERLEKLYTALSFTWLQIVRTQQADSSTPKKITEIIPVVKRLSKYSQYGIKHYREKDGCLDKYLGYWDSYIGR